MGLVLANIIGIPFFSMSGRVLPACARDNTVAWFRDLNNIKTIDGDDYTQDSIGTRTNTVYYGQYLDNTSGQINFLRTSGTFDYIDPSDGSLVEGVSIPGTGLYTIPENGICNIGINPRIGDITGLLNFDGIDDYVELSSVPDVTGSKTISLNIYIPSLSSPTGAFLLFDDGGNDILYGDIVGNVVRFVTSTGGAVPNGGINIDLTTRKDTVLNIVITKTARTLSVVTVNGENESGFITTGYGGVSGSLIGSSSSPHKGLYIWDININNEHAYSGRPAGNLDTAWVDTIGSIDGTVYGSPTDININSDGTVLYTGFYPVCERAGTVLHDINENSKHISVASPSWSESLYGSDYLNQYGYVNKTDSDALGYDWETLVNGSDVTLNDDTLVPLAQWTMAYSANGNNFPDKEISRVKYDLEYDSSGDQYRFKGAASELIKIAINTGDEAEFFGASPTYTPIYFDPTSLDYVYGDQIFLNVADQRDFVWVNTVLTGDCLATMNTFIKNPA